MSNPYDPNQQPLNGDNSSPITLLNNNRQNSCQPLTTAQPTEQLPAVNYGQQQLNKCSGVRGGYDQQQLTQMPAVNYGQQQQQIRRP